MRAPPYDVTGFGLEPIGVETAAGRREYADEQRGLVSATDPLRARLIAALESVREQVGGAA